MRALNEFPCSEAAAVVGVFADIDDTITSDGRLLADAYAAMQDLYQAGLHVVPVTGRPAGWCDHIARMWPVSAVVGENGAFYFHYDRQQRCMRRRFVRDDAARKADRRRLDELATTILAQVPGCAVAADQRYREADLAIDFCEDVPPLGDASVRRIVELFAAAGANAKVSSIHVNGWFGAYDKLGMSAVAARECLGIDLGEVRERIVFIGDSPNDAPMFEYFPNAVGVANVRDYRDRIDCEPRYVTSAKAGAGFCELARHLLDARAATAPASGRRGAP